MPKVHPDFTQSIAPNKPGDYLCRVMSSELKYGNTSGDPYISWKLQTIPDHRAVFHSTPLTGKGSGMFKHMIHACGDTDYDSGEYDTDALTGVIVAMRLSVDPNGYFVVKSVGTPTKALIDSVPKISVTPNTTNATKSFSDLPF